ncbi:Agd3-related carbohydrate deacetylase, partial [Nitrosomonas communis]
YETFTAVALIQAEITKNRTVWGLLGLPEQANNNRVLLTGNHAGLKDRKCTDDPLLHTNMANVQDDDVAFDQGGANPLFLRAAANTNVQYIASDSSQRAQNIEQYITQYDDGKPTDRIMLPRWPTNVFVNVINPDQLVDEYNYMFHDRFVNAGQDPCTISGAICTPRSYAEILAAEADNAVRHMLSFNKWPHFFHQSNAANYANGNTLIFDWLNAVFAAYERLFKLPVLNLPYWQIGDKTKQRLDAKTAIIQAKWDRATNQVTLSANKAVTLEVTGITGGGTYGGQYVRPVNVTTTPTAFTVNRGLTQ